jgi:hypothetical protein
MQLMLVGILILWPGLVTGFVEKPATNDPSSIQIELEKTAPPVQPPPVENDNSATSAVDSRADERSNEIEKLLKQPR